MRVNGIKNDIQKHHNGTVTIFDYKKDGSLLRTVIDLPDFKKILTLNARWNILRTHQDGVYRVIGSDGKKRFSLPRFIMDCPENLVVDHIDRDTLNNRRSNLRNVTQKNNTRNRKDSDYRFVHYDRNINRYRIYVGDILPHQTYYGAYEKMEDAKYDVKHVRRI